jgi:hypothetical protein
MRVEWWIGIDALLSMDLVVAHRSSFEERGSFLPVVVTVAISHLDRRRRRRRLIAVSRRNKQPEVVENSK